MESALSEEALQNRIDDAEATLVEWAGTVEEVNGVIQPVTETVRAYGRSTLPLRQEPASIVSVTDTFNLTPTVLDESGFLLVGGHYLERVGYYWGSLTTVTYIPKDDRAKRRMALLDLVRLRLNREPGFTSQSAGSWQESYSAASAEDEILFRLRRPEFLA